MMSIKNINKKYILLFILFFLLGNRCYQIFEFNIKLKNYTEAFLSVFYDFLPSFGSNYLGYQISFNINALIIGALSGTGILVVIAYRSLNKKNYMSGEEHGTARYGNIENEATLLKDEKYENNIPYSKNISVSMNTRKTFLNNNTLTIGGSGSGKTMFHVKPSALQFNCNYIITDPKNTLIKDLGYAFKKNGYDIKYLNLVDMSKSMKYNPLKYIEKPSDVIKFVNNFITNTTKENSNNGGDDFFLKAEIAWMTFAIFFILSSPDPKERNLNTLMELLDLADASEEDENAKSILDIMMDELEKSYNKIRDFGFEDKSSYTYLAIRQYHLYKKASGKTAKSILISLGVRLQVFNIPELANLLSDDELDLETIGKPKLDINGKMIKTVLFVSISDYDSTYSFMASIIYQQLYEILYRIADSNPKGRLPIHTRFILDEFANTGKQQDFEIKVATMRSREISVDIILQNLAQLKNLYKDSWETIVGNCDVTLFLGGKEYTTLEQLSKWIGNATIDYLSITENRGMNGGWSRNNQLIQRLLLAPDEIARLKRDECLVHIRGEHIFRDKKYNLQDHPNYKLTADYNEANYFDISDVLKRSEVTKYFDEKAIQQIGNTDLLSKEIEMINVS